MGYYSTFVVKIWCNGRGGMTRGHVQHVGSQELTHFLRLENLTDFITSHLYPPSSDNIAMNSMPGRPAVNLEDRRDNCQDD